MLIGHLNRVHKWLDVARRLFDDLVTVSARWETAHKVRVHRSVIGFASVRALTMPLRGVQIATAPVGDAPGPSKAPASGGGGGGGGSGGSGGSGTGSGGDGDDGDDVDGANTATREAEISSATRRMAGAETELRSIRAQMASHLGTRVQGCARLGGVCWTCPGRNTCSGLPVMRCARSLHG